MNNVTLTSTATTTTTASTIATAIYPAGRCIYYYSY